MCGRLKVPSRLSTSEQSDPEVALDEASFQCRFRRRNCYASHVLSFQQRQPFYSGRTGCRVRSTIADSAVTAREDAKRRAGASVPMGSASRGTVYRGQCSRDGKGRCREENSRWPKDAMLISFSLEQEKGCLPSAPKQRRDWLLLTRHFLPVRCVMRAWRSSELLPSAGRKRSAGPPCRSLVSGLSGTPYRLGLQHRPLSPDC
ncbi:hypothetical protein BCV69DRAFT_182630 [Microstroma glucosiphilum]|uniref:Uncharacterized protein n=1 Tax=Pseudomicrostroma glucosiphilum TaxID=1684307 RepID=A0A316U9A8_9BASI|nr:hypothetical protein BCV69DRAFT_182630 [Pseudomicrostroma glucosiphilum]PWN21051.1 hypothetical protein BCV69DRAFT_182630 [Pseudomicrostroma glucosiphilum]